VRSVGRSRPERALRAQGVRELVPSRCRASGGPTVLPVERTNAMCFPSGDQDGSKSMNVAL
jgi:hypothetical protein